MPSKGWTRPCRVALPLALALGILQAQIPPESTSKVKRVLLYEKVLGWNSTEAIAEIGRTFEHLARVKGFQVDTLKSDSGLTPENLKRYQAMIWNNNGYPSASVPSPSARSAVMDYLRQGGSWMLLHLASDHAYHWREYGEVLGAAFSLWYTGGGFAELVADSAAEQHPELRHVLSALPDSLRLHDLWLSFDRTVRPLPGVTVLYTARNGEGRALVPLADGSQDHPYVWAREVDRGRLLFNGLVHGNKYQGVPVTAQADSAVTRMLWMTLRWLAGDFRNGCTDPTSARFDPEARIDDGSCSHTGRTPGLAAAPSGLRLAGRRLRVDGMPAEGIRISLRDLRGALVWRRTLPAGAADIHIDASLDPGVYLLEARASGRSFFLRAAMP